MALRGKTIFVYGLEINSTNRYINFRAVNAGPELTATLTAGFYSITSIAAEIKRALEATDPANVYDVTIDRTVNNNTENRLTIETSGSYLDLLFSSGTQADASIRDVVSFGNLDYTGNTSYTNGATSGIRLETELAGYSYEPPQVNLRNFGTVNVSASGLKEAITWSTQRFLGVNFKYEPEAKVFTEWRDFIEWMIGQKPFDVTIDITDPNTVYECTLERSTADGKGLGFNMREMLPQFPFFYETGKMMFRLRGDL